MKKNKQTEVIGKQQGYERAKHHLPLEELEIIKPHSQKKDKPSILSLQWVKSKIPFTKKRKKGTEILVRIELKNGNFRSLIVNEEKGGLIYEDGLYLFDNVSKRFDIDNSMWFYYFHEDYSLPITFKLNKNVKKAVLPIDSSIPVNEIKDLIESTQISQVEYASNPSALHRFMTSEVIKMVLQGVALDSVFRFLKIMSIIILVVVCATLLILLNTSGALKGFKIF